MLYTKLFTKTRKEAPADEVSKNAQLLIRAGYIHKEMAGVYAYLPLGLKVLNNIIQVIREEMNAIGGQEITMTALQDKTVWEKTDRWDDAKVDNWFKTKLKNDTELGLGFTHEEPITAMLKSFVSSYRDLPFSVYQFQTKFRNETRAKSGIMRCREFIMKDLYSFCKDEAQHQEFYESASKAYQQVFARLGLGDITYFTFASGGSFSKFSHEFQTLTEAGEDLIYVDNENKIAINKEVYAEDATRELREGKNLTEEKAVEVGNIFTLGTKFSQALDLTYKNEAGESVPVFMGSYGIGPGRLMGTIVEVLSDDKGIVWPEAVAPFKVQLVHLGEAAYEKAGELYVALGQKGVSVLWDDRTDAGFGEKLKDADLLGMPKIVIVSEKTLAENCVELKDRKTGALEKVAFADVAARIA